MRHTNPDYMRRKVKKVEMLKKSEKSWSFFFKSLQKNFYGLYRHVQGNWKYNTPIKKGNTKENAFVARRCRWTVWKILHILKSYRISIFFVFWASSSAVVVLVVKILHQCLLKCNAMFSRILSKIMVHVEKSLSTNRNFYCFFHFWNVRACTVCGHFTLGSSKMS